jgi:tetratricopeptide (TPR) repeat protein
MDLKENPEDTSPQAIFDWQHHFRQAPNRQQTEQLKQAVKQKKPLNDPAALLKQARNLNTLGQLEQAEVTYRKLLRVDEEHFDGHLELAQLCLAKSQPEKAFDYIVAARDLVQSRENPNQADVFKYQYTLALGYLATQRIDEGRRVLSDLIAARPDFAPGYVALAGSYLTKQKYDLAEFVAKRGIDRSEGNTDLWNVLGVVAAQKGDYHQARSWYNRLLNENPDHVPALVNRANIALIRHEYAAAESDLNRAVSLNPGYVNAHIALGILYKKTGRFTTAKGSFERALELHPESSYARFNLALLMADQFHDRNTAMRLFYEVLQTKDQPQDLKTRAQIHIQGLRENRLNSPHKSL